MKKLIFIAALSAFAAGLLFSQNVMYDREDLLGMALAGNSSLAEKLAREKAAQYGVAKARSMAGPTLDFETTMTYLTNPDKLTVEAGTLGVLDLSGLGGPVFPMPAEDTTFEMSGNTYYDFKLILEQPLFTWGKIANALKASKEGAAAASLDTQKIRELLATEISVNCLSLHYLKEIELAVSKQEELARRMETIASDSFSSGMIVRSELLEIEARRMEAELAVRKIAYQIDRVVLNLSSLAGTELTAVMIRTEPMEWMGEESWEEVYGEAAENNRDLSMLRHSISVEENRYRIQKGQFYFKPDLAFHAELSWSGGYFPLIQEEWNDKDRGNLALTLSIRSPLADLGGLYAESRSAGENLQAAKAQYGDAASQIEKAVRQTLKDMELNRLNIQYFRDRLNQDEEIISQREKEWLSGYGDEKDYLAARLGYYSRIIELNQEFISLGTNQFSLENLRGNVNY